MLRIVAGKFGGRLVKSPEGLSTRPTSQFAREALFSILADEIPGAAFVDLFAGSGAVGIEALSRGAAYALFADSGRGSCRAINENLAMLGLGRGEALALNMDLTAQAAFAMLRDAVIGLSGGPARIVFADPPYAYGGAAGLPVQISSAGICNAGGIIVIEHGAKAEMPETGGAQGPGLHKYSVRRYGGSCFSFYRV